MPRGWKGLRLPDPDRVPCSETRLDPIPNCVESYSSTTPSRTQHTQSISVARTVQRRSRLRSIPDPHRSIRIVQHHTTQACHAERSCDPRTYIGCNWCGAAVGGAVGLWGPGGVTRLREGMPHPRSRTAQPYQNPYQGVEARGIVRSPVQESAESRVPGRSVLRIPNTPAPRVLRRY